MSPRKRSMIIGISGFFAGAVIASIVPWSPLPKAVLVGAVIVLVSTVVWALLRSKSFNDRAR